MSALEFEITETGKIQSDYINTSFDVLELGLKAYCDLNEVDLKVIK